MSTGLKPFAMGRLPLFAVLVLLVLVGRCAAPAPAARSQADLRRLLVADLGAAASVGALGWEPSRGIISDALLGRPLLGLVRQADEPSDLFRFLVRVSPEGHPLAVAGAFNLTRTALGDESQLAVVGQHALLATRAYGQLQGVSLLQLAPRWTEAEESGGLLGALRGLRHLQRSGTWDGIRRIQLELPEGAPLELELERTRLLLRHEQTPQAALSLAGVTEVEAEAGFVLVVEPPASPHWLQMVVDLVREEVGPIPIAWLEQRVFGLEDQVRRNVGQLLEPAPQLHAAQALPSSAQVLPGQWPPAPLSPLLEPSMEGEGRWRAPDVAWMREVSDPSMMTTFLRPDKERPYARVHLVALDMRRLELRMEAGYEDPRPKTGPPGRGALPTDPAVRSRVVATFNGAFKSVHGEYGMMVDRRILVPPQPGAATIATTADGRVGMGPWPSGSGALPELRSLRQNLDLMVHDGVVNPNQRRHWGDQVLGEGVVTERSAACLAANGHLYYAWGQDVTGTTFAEALKHSGCVSAMHLDMNPKHCAFFFRDGALKGARAKVARPEMLVPVSRHLKWSSQDFFYVLTREPEPLEGWKTSVGAQPPPARIPGIFRRSNQLGALEVQLLRVQPDRLAWTVLAGKDEPVMAGRPAPVRQLSSGERGLLAINLGRTTTSTRLGLAYSADATIPHRSDAATLVFKAGELKLLPPSGSPVQSGDGVGTVQLPLLASGETLTDRAKATGARRQRGAFCLTVTGAVVVATALHDSSDVLALALVDQGCELIVELDRGSKHPVFVHRDGTEQPVKSSYPTTTLVGVPQQMPPRSFVWGDVGH